MRPNCRTDMIMDITPVLSLLSVIRAISPISDDHKPVPHPKIQHHSHEIIGERFIQFKHYAKWIKWISPMVTFHKATENNEPATDAHEIHSASHTVQSGPEEKDGLRVTSAVWYPIIHHISLVFLLKRVKWFSFVLLLHFLPSEYWTA